MSTWTLTVQELRSKTAGTRPSSLLDGQLFINLADGVICWNDAGAVVRTTWLDNAQGAPKVVTAGTYTVLATDRHLVFNTLLTEVVTLPMANAANAGRRLTIKTIAGFGVNSASANVKPLTSNTAGVAILTATAGKWADLVCDGTNWVIMAGN